MIRVALALGSNLGDKHNNISRGIALLEEGGFSVKALSSLMESAPVDCPQGSDFFLNGALWGEWQGSCRELMELCQQIEIETGRLEVREINSPRPLDLDILLFGGELIDEADLIVPHKRMLERDFVMLPLLEIAADWIIPGKGGNVRELSMVFL